jgi:hypothetical protein
MVAQLMVLLSLGNRDTAIPGVSDLSRSEVALITLGTMVKGISPADHLLAVQLGDPF